MTENESVCECTCKKVCVRRESSSSVCVCVRDYREKERVCVCERMC